MPLTKRPDGPIEEIPRMTVSGLTYPWQFAGPGANRGADWKDVELAAQAETKEQYEARMLREAPLMRNANAREPAEAVEEITQ